MTTIEASRIAENISYPKLSITILGPHDGNMTGFHITNAVMDSDRPAQPVFLSSLDVMGDAPDETNLISWIFDELCKFVLHEVREFFMYKGEPIYHPHLPVKDLQTVANRYMTYARLGELKCS